MHPPGSLSVCACPSSYVQQRIPSRRKKIVELKLARDDDNVRWRVAECHINGVKFTWIRCKFNDMTSYSGLLKTRAMFSEKFKFQNTLKREFNSWTLKENNAVRTMTNQWFVNFENLFWEVFFFILKHFDFKNLFWIFFKQTWT